MQTIKAVCECKNMSEEDQVVAVQRDRFKFLDDWSVLIWIGVVIMTLITGGFWLIGILTYHFNDILRPQYYCSQCERLVFPKQFRI